MTGPPEHDYEWGALSADEFRVYLNHAMERDPGSFYPLLRLRFRYRKDEFLQFCWPDRFDLGFNEMHEYLFQISDIPPWYERGKPDILEAVAAPRGMGKSTIASFGDVAHAIVYDTEAYIVLISSARELVWDLSSDLLSQFKPPEDGQDDRALTKLYGPFQVKGGKSSWQVSVRGRPPVAVVTKSFGQAIRGIKHPTRGIRPTLVVLDDAEDKVKVRNPDQRTLLENTLSKDILKLGARHKGTAFRFVGTVLHTDSILNRRMRDPGWRARKFAAIIQWPSEDAQVLWRQCRDIWADLSIGPARRAKAGQFYEEHKAQMDDGAALLDPDGMPLFQLYEQIWGQGYASFLQEMQNEPIDPTVAIFHSESFAYFSEGTDSKGRRVLHVEGARPRIVREENLTFRFIHWDPAGGDISGDYAAIAAVARDSLGYKYVLDCWMARRPPSAQRSALWNLAEKWGVKQAILESNGFADLAAEPFERERTERMESGQFWGLELGTRAASTAKTERIASLEPEISNGWVIFNRRIRHEVLEQFDQFPTGDYDDAPDAIQAACEELGSAGQSIGMTG